MADARKTEELTGYVWTVEPTAEAAKHVPPSDLTEEQQAIGPLDYGFHGNDIAPCGGEYLADQAGGGYLVLTKLSEAPEYVEGWMCERADLEEGRFYNDGAWCWAVLDVALDGEVLIAGIERGKGSFHQLPCG